MFLRGMYSRSVVRSHVIINVDTVESNQRPFFVEFYHRSHALDVWYPGCNRHHSIIQSTERTYWSIVVEVSDSEVCIPVRLAVCV